MCIRDSSPGMYYTRTADKADNLTYTTTVIPYRGAWLEYETDLSDLFYVRIDKNRKLPITCLIRALGPRTDAEIIEMFGEDERILATMEKLSLIHILTPTVEVEAWTNWLLPM